jgi:hypothetical protein
MTTEIEKLRAEMMTGRKAIADTIGRLNNDGTHPGMVIEGAMIAILEASTKINSAGSLVDWLRDAADNVEEYLFKQMRRAEHGQ